MDEEKELSESQEEENKSAISADLIRGHINTIILRTLYDIDKYGYEIIEEIEKKSHGQYSLKQPTLYSALKRLESQGYINAYWKTDEVSLGGRRKYYTLTDSGREITEKNQSEWEYSRTVIDNLISDRSFDFSQPAPTSSVDFKILKKSTTRVPVVKDDDDDEETDEDVQPVTENKLPEIEIKKETVTYTDQVVYCNPPIIAQAPVQETPPAPPAPSAPPETPPYQTAPPAPEPQRVIREEREVKQETSAAAQAAYEEEQRRRVHENYMRLISEPVNNTNDGVVPVADHIDTEKLIYNNKPKTERDYKNLINNLYENTVNQGYTSEREKKAKENTYNEKSYNEPTASEIFDDITQKAELDGLKVNASEFAVTTRKKSYNRGATLFKSSLVVAVILLLEFTFSLLFKENMGVDLAYPFVIFSIAIAQLLIFGIIFYADYGKSSRKPTSTTYLTASIIITIILLVVIFLISLLLQVNFGSAGDIFAKIIMPYFVALNIPVFTGSFYLFSKYL